MQSVFRPFGGADKVQRRVFEWFAGAVALWLGFLSASGSEFYAWELMQRVGGGGVWTVALFSLGLVRLIALYVNGRWRPTYHIRVLCSVVSAIVWFELALAAIGAASLPFRLEGSVVFSAMIVSEAFVASIAAREARVADEAARITGR